MRLLPALSLSLVVLTAAGVAAAAPAGFAFLEVPASARAAALGGAYSTLVRGVESTWWNTAQLATTGRFEIAGGHSELFNNLRHDYFAAGTRMFGGGVSGSIRALYTEPIDERDDLGNLIGSFGAHDLELMLGYGRGLGGGLSLGGSASIVRERIANNSVQTWSLGVSSAWQPAALPGLRVALAGQNLGPAGHYTIDGSEGDAVDLPAAVQGGASYGIGLGARLKLAAAVEGRAVTGRPGVGMAGAELADASGAALRVGYRANDTSTGVTFGVGWEQPKYGFDYAFVPLKDDLGDTHRFGFTARF